MSATQNATANAFGEIASQTIIGAYTPFVCAAVLTPLVGPVALTPAMGALFLGTRSLSAHVIDLGLREAGFNPILASIIGTVTSLAIAAAVTAAALGTTFTFTAGIVFTLQAIAASITVSLVVFAVLATIAVGVVVVGGIGIAIAVNAFGMENPLHSLSSSSEQLD